MLWGLHTHICQRECSLLRAGADWGIDEISDGCVIELSMILDPSGCKTCNRCRQDLIAADMRLKW